MTVNIHDAKTNLSRLLKRVALGEEVIIAKAGRPIARLTPYGEDEPERVEGRDRGVFTVPDTFDEPLPEDVLEDFYR
ncbi:MAG: type II toxin-antitoxin system Phd/YefM family antitoxin [Spirochaetota bacterium]